MPVFRFLEGGGNLQGNKYQRGLSHVFVTQFGMAEVNSCIQAVTFAYLIY